MEVLEAESKFNGRLKEYFPFRKEYKIEYKDGMASLYFLNYKISTEFSLKRDQVAYLFEQGVIMVETAYQHMKNKILKEKENPSTNIFKEPRRNNQPKNSINENKKMKISGVKKEIQQNQNRISNIYDDRKYSVGQKEDLIDFMLIKINEEKESSFIKLNNSKGQLNDNPGIESQVLNLVKEGRPEGVVQEKIAKNTDESMMCNKIFELNDKADKKSNAIYSIMDNAFDNKTREFNNKTNNYNKTNEFNNKTNNCKLTNKFDDKKNNCKLTNEFDDKKNNYNLAGENKIECLNDDKSAYIDFNSANSSILDPNRSFINFNMIQSDGSFLFPNNCAISEASSPIISGAPAYSGISQNTPVQASPIILGAPAYSGISQNTIVQASPIIYNKMDDQSHELQENIKPSINGQKNTNENIPSEILKGTDSTIKYPHFNEFTEDRNEKVLEQNNSVINSTALDTSIIEDTYAGKVPDSTPVCLRNPPGPAAKIESPCPTDDSLVPETDYIKSLFIKYKDAFRGTIQIVREFCAKYKIAPPEFEIVRENDVYRCTALFMDINFVSSYEYDKLDSKEEACKKILDYVIRNWEAVFKHKSCLLKE